MIFYQKLKMTTIKNGKYIMLMVATNNSIQIPMSRWQAGAIHFGISVLIIFIIGIVLLNTWYPLNFITVSGGLYLMTILAVVDACIGPLLTTIVFKTGKPSLKFDLTVIVLLQIIAMGYGLYSIYLARPVFLLFAVDRFELINAAEIMDKDLAEAKYPEFRTLSITGPVIGAIQKSNDPQVRKQALFEWLPQGLDYKNFPKYYVPYIIMAKEAVAKGKTHDTWKPLDKPAHLILDDYLRQHNLQSSHIKLLPLSGKRTDKTILIDSTSGVIRGIVNIDPW